MKPLLRAERVAGLGGPLARGRLRSRAPDEYPWSPVVVGEDPAHSYEALVRAIQHASASGAAEPTVFVASLDEWSEGHHLEPDVRFGNGWREAVRAARR